ncbi:DNA topoisomerase 2 [Tanacetum coccineum]
MGTVIFIEPELDSYYLECVMCAKNKVRKSQVAYLGDINIIDEDGVTLICRKCKTIQPEFVQRIQVSINVEDYTERASFVLLDSYLTKMTGSANAQIVNWQEDVGSGNRDLFPPSDADPDNPSSSMVKRETDVVATDCSTNSKLIKLKIESP